MLPSGIRAASARTERDCEREGAGPISGDATGHERGKAVADQQPRLHGWRAMDGRLLQAGTSHVPPSLWIASKTWTRATSHSPFLDLPALARRHSQDGFRRKDTEEGRRQKLPWDGLQQHHPPGSSHPDAGLPAPAGPSRLTWLPGSVPMDNHRTAWSTSRNHGRPQGLCAKGFVQFMGGVAHLMVPKTPIPLEDQPLTSAAGAIRATHNLCMDEEGLRRC